MRINNCSFFVFAVVGLAFGSGCSRSTPTDLAAADPPVQSAKQPSPGTDQDASPQLGPTRNADIGHQDSHAANHGHGDHHDSFPSPETKAADNQAVDPDFDRHGDQDDPNAEVIVVAQNSNEENDPPLNNGRGDLVEPANNSTAVKGPRDPDTTKLPGRPSPLPANVTPSKKKQDSDLSDAKKTKTDTLPDQQQALDKDKDGQIGLYEWPRDQLDEFKKLDENNDGFLSPQELADKDASEKPGK